jgi:hypothetical protein
MAADKQPRSLTQRGRFWLKHLQRWSQSGLSQAQYCRQQQLSVPAFGWWKGQLSAGSGRAGSVITSDKRADPQGAFVEVAVATSGGPEAGGDFPYEIALGNHRCLRLGRGFEGERVRQLLALLESRC